MNPSLALLPFSAIYSAVTRARLVAYRRGWFSVSRLPAPVISVGNLTTGGTGKTPLVEWVCRTLAQSSVSDAAEGSYEGRRVCVLTRGYGRANPKTQVVVSNGAELQANVREAGDEPFLLARNLLGTAALVANPNRFAAGEWALEKLHSEVLVLDDGFQHLPLARDLDIVTIDATNPFGGGGLLPQGHLREPRSGLSRADCVVLTRTDQTGDLDSLKAVVEHLTDPIPIFTSRMLPAGIRNLAGQSVTGETAEMLKAQPLAAFCGVGNPASFFRQLRNAGYTLACTRVFADHHNYNQSELDGLVTEAKNAGARGLMTTAKDAVKLSVFSFDLPCYALDILISIDEEERLAKMLREVAKIRAR